MEEIKFGVLVFAVLMFVIMTTLLFLVSLDLRSAETQLYMYQRLCPIEQLKENVNGGK